MVDAPKTHDIKISDGTTERGYMLARDNGRKIWDVAPMPQLAEQQYTGELSYQQTPPQYELVLAQYDWSYGLDYRSSRRKDSYFLAYNVDTRIPGKVFVGPASTQTDNGVPAGSNMGFETWAASVLSSWTDSGLTACVEETTIVESGSSAKCTNTSGSVKYLGQTPESTGRLRGSSLTVTCSVYPDTVGGAELYYDTGAGKVTGTASTGTGAWESITVTLTNIANAATKLEFGIAFANNTITYVDTAALTVGGMTNPAVGFAELSSELYLATESCVYKWDNTNTQWDCKLYASATITDFVTFDTKLFIAFGSSNAYYYSSDGDTWIANSSNSTAAQKFAVWNNTLWKADGNEIKSSIAPVDGDWSDAIEVGDSTFDVNKLVIAYDELYIAKPDGLYFIDAIGVAHTVSPFLRFMTNSSSGKQTTEWQGSVYYPVKNGGLIKYTPETNVIADSGPRMVSDNPYLDGNIVALAGDSTWLYAFMDESYSTDESTLLATNISGNWHGFLSGESIDDIRTAHISTLQSATNKYLWFAGRHTAISNENKPRYIVLPINYNAPDDDSSYVFNDSDVNALDLWGCYMDGGLIVANKIVNKVGLRVGNPQYAPRSVKFTYFYDNNSQVTEPNLAHDAFYEEHSFTTRNSVKRIQPRFTFINIDSARSVRLEGCAIYTILVAHKKKLYRFAVRVADNITNYTGVRETILGSILVSHLNGCENIVGTLTDLDGTSHTVLFRPMQESFVKDEKGQDEQRVFYIEAVEVS